MDPLGNLLRALQSQSALQGTAQVIENGELTAGVLEGRFRV